MQNTTNYGLKKPDASDTYNIDDFNYNADTIDSQLKNQSNEINILKESVSSGKATVATAITGKGVPTVATDTFQQMATNISLISTEYDDLPIQVTNFNVTANDLVATLNWSVSSTTNLSGFRIVYKKDSVPTSHTDGQYKQVTSSTRSTAITVPDYSTYYFRMFPYNEKNQYQNTQYGAVVNESFVKRKLLSELPVGAKIKDLNSKYNGEPIIWEVLDHNHSGYPVNSTTVLVEKIITLKAFDGMEASNPDSNRKSYGNNRYMHSNIRKWLNTDANSWYSAQHSYDAPPTAANVWSNYNPYNGENGFLANLTTEFKSKILTTTLEVAKSTVTDGGGSETLSDKVFLLSTTEVGLANENGISEGVAFSKFSSDSDRLANPTSQAVDNNTYLNVGLADGKPWYWWLRTPDMSSTYLVRYVRASGTLDRNNAYSGIRGVRPTLNLQSGIVVSDSPDSDGAYIIEW